MQRTVAYISAFILALCVGTGLLARDQASAGSAEAALSEVREVAAATALSEMQTAVGAADAVPEGQKSSLETDSAKPATSADASAISWEHQSDSEAAPTMSEGQNPTPKHAGEEKSAEDWTVTGVIFGHIMDSYEWHMATVNGHHISIYLPVIVRGHNSGWHCFSSRRLEENGGTYEGFTLASGGTYDGKLVEIIDGEQVRPLDISITKNVLALMISGLLLVVIILLVARWYRHNDSLEKAPTGIAALFEPLIMMVSGICKEAIGEDDYRRFEPYICTVFFFILFNNLLGIVPFFPGGANVTGNIAVTFVLALFSFLAINLFGNKHYYKDIFWPDVPWWLKCPIPILPVIEVFSAFVKGFSLMVRLFANMMAGHILILSMCCIIFIMAKMGPVLAGSMTLVSVLFGVFMDCLEVLVAFVQAYVFTILSASFIGMAHVKEEK